MDLHFACHLPPMQMITQWQPELCYLTLLTEDSLFQPNA